jgi:hypothetical protein
MEYMEWDEPWWPQCWTTSGREFFNAIEKQLNHSKLKVRLLNGKNNTNYHGHMPESLKKGAAKGQ